MEENIKNRKMNNVLKIIFAISCIMFAIPSITYYIQNKTVFRFEQWFKFLLNDASRIEQTYIYILILLAMSITYFLIIKNREKIFKNTRRMFLYIAIISLIFVAVIPFTCSDVFYYLGIGRINSEYNQNPYYTTIKQFVESDNNSKYLEQDTVLAQGYINDWSDSTVVYGPIWTLICRIVASISFGNIDIGLLLFKLVNLLVHILNCYLIYKISNKKIFTLLYGLNPLILIEGIACVHNDMFVILFALASFYFILKKKNIVLSLLFLALATAIKYFTILLLPFIIIYYARKEKPLKRFIRCIQYGSIFIIMLLAPYLLYIQDFNVFAGLFIQQEKIAKNFYVIITEYFKEPLISVTNVNRVLLEIFTIIYFFTCLTILNKRKITWKKEIQKANYFIIAFLFLLITNFQPWYIMWLFLCLAWQKAEDIRLIIQISLISEFSNSVFLIYSEGWKNGVPFTFFMITGILFAVLYNSKIKKQKFIDKQIQKIDKNYRRKEYKQ